MSKSTPTTNGKKNFEDMTPEEVRRTPLDEIQDPSLVPVGLWRLECVFAKVQDPLPGDTYKQAYFLMHTPVEAIDADEKLVEEGGWRGARVRTTLRFSSAHDKAYIKQVFEAHGVSTEGRPGDVLCEVMKGREVLATVGIRSWEKKTDEGPETVVENKLSGWRRFTDAA